MDVKIDRKHYNASICVVSLINFPQTDKPILCFTDKALSHRVKKVSVKPRVRNGEESFERREDFSCLY